MVASIRDFRNITTSTSVIHFTTDIMSPNNISNMEVNSFDDIFEKACDHYNEIRGHSLVLSTHCSYPQVTIIRTMQQEFRKKVTG